MGPLAVVQAEEVGTILCGSWMTCHQRFDSEDISSVVLVVDEELMADA